MTASLAALLGFAALVVALLIFIVGYRTLIVVSAKAPANSWTRGNAKWENPGLITRAEHAHANCVEMLPLFGAVILVAALTDQLGSTDGLAYGFLAARLGQTLTHILGASAAFVMARGSFFAIQLVILSIWLLKLGGLV